MLSEFVRKLCSEITNISIALVITLLFPVLLAVLSPVLLFRLCVIKCAKYFKPNLGEILSPRSVMMTLGSVYENPKSVMVKVFTVKGTPDIQKVREAVVLKLLNVSSSTSPTHMKKDQLFPELKQNLVYWMGFLFWRSLESFNLEDHVYNYIPDNGEKLNPQKLTQFVNELTSKPWSRGKALWEIIIIPNTALSESSKNESMILFRLHHGLADGFSVLKLEGCVDESGNVNQALKRIYTPGQRKPLINNVYENFQYFLKAPYDLAKSTFLQSPDDDPWSLKGREFGGYSCGATSQKIDLKEFRDTKNSLGVEFLVLLTAIKLGGIRETIKSRGNKLPKSLLVKFPLPLPGHSKKLRNNMTFGSILVDLTEEDSSRRIKSIQRSYEKVRKSTIPTTMSRMCLLAGYLFPWVLEPMHNKSFMFQYIIISNIPGASAASDIFGHAVRETFFTCSAANTAGLNFVAFTHAGDMTINVAADSSILPTNEDAKDLIANIQREFELIQKF